MAPRVPVTDPEDQRISTYRSIREPELIRTDGVFVAEGRLVLQRVVECGLRVRSVLVNEAASSAMAATLDALHAPVYVCDAATIAQISGYHVHRGCLGLVDRPEAADPVAIARSGRTVVALEDVTNPDNVGGVFRNAAAFGAAVLLSPRCADPLYRKAVRTSMGAVLSVPWAVIDDWPAGVFALREHGFLIAALTPRAPSTTLETFAAEHAGGKIVLVAGTEGAGLSEAVEGAADARVRIPIADTVDSLNLSVAVGIVLSRLAG